MPRQRIVLGLGRLLEIPDVEQKILLTARINELIKGTPTLFNTRAPLKTTFFDAFVRIILRPFQHGNLQVLENISYISNMLLGVLIRQIIFSNRNKEMKTKLLFILDLVMLLADSIFGMFFPIIRNLWKGFFVLVTCGIFTLLLALFYLIIDVWGYRKYLFFFVVFGANSIAIYIMVLLFDFILIGNILFGGSSSLFSLNFQAFIQAVTAMIIMWLIICIEKRHLSRFKNI